MLFIAITAVQSCVSNNLVKYVKEGSMFSFIVKSMQGCTMKCIPIKEYSKIVTVF